MPSLAAHRKRQTPAIDAGRGEARLPRLKVSGETPRGSSARMRRVEPRRIFLRVESLSLGAGGNCSGTSSAEPGVLFPEGTSSTPQNFASSIAASRMGMPFAHGDELEHVAAFLALEAVKEPLARRDDERAIVAGFAEVASAAPRVAVLLEDQAQETDDDVDASPLALTCWKSTVCADIGQSPLLTSDIISSVSSRGGAHGSDEREADIHRACA